MVYQLLRLVPGATAASAALGVPWNHSDCGNGLPRFPVLMVAVPGKARPCPPAHPADAGPGADDATGELALA